MNRPNIGKVVRHFHLAFKGMEGAEIYDVLMELLIAAANGYDPHYKQKVKQVVEVIEDELPRQKRITAALVNRHLEFDCDRHLRMLARAGFLEVVPGKGGKEEGPVEQEFVRLGAWPFPLPGEPRWAPPVRSSGLPLTGSGLDALQGSELRDCPCSAMRITSPGSLDCG